MNLMSSKEECVIVTHSREVCEGPCPFHRPSDHHMVNWPMKMRMDRMDKLTERVCFHGLGHPDPDSLSFLEKKFDESVGVHGCCGCCREGKS